MDNPSAIEYLKTQTAVRSLCFSADDQRLAAGTNNGDILIWYLSAPETNLMRLIGHLSAVTALHFGVDGQMLISGSLDKTVRIWDANNAEAESVAITHDGWVWDVALSPDGDRVVSGSADRNIRILTMRTGKMAEQLCQKLTRNLSEREWRTYVGEDIPYERTCPELSENATVGQQP
jgi:WD40 repeat protein